ncbi:MAG: hypothetical protein EVG15_08260 [Candidatus Acididesulfobacter diazotrophicus]|uniref:Uncharacterized protein n=1 Tax=Candidatus Acididesulfobacter diazotrophicus TaxID=2597226 RepID=A0A519BL94_9DELT|nr:MAG: hypothetical protein EVG15_08260 [Candidatus Acididesulfobacter diazotrophicus]
MGEFKVLKSKALIVILSGAENPVKVLLGLNMAWRTMNSGAFEDVKLIFVGQAEDFIAKTDDKEILEAYRQILNNNIMSHACVVIADAYGVTDILIGKKVIMVPSAGGCIAQLMSEGYQPMTF